MPASAGMTVEGRNARQALRDRTCSTSSGSETTPPPSMQGLTNRGLAPLSAEAHRASTRRAARTSTQAAGGAGAPQRGLEGHRQGEGVEGRGDGCEAHGRGRRAEGGHRQGRGGGARAQQGARGCARRHPQPAARRRAGRHGRERQQGGAQGRHAAEVRLRAEAALRDRRGAGPHGLRDRGQDFRRALRRAEGRAGAPRARARAPSCSTCTRASSATPSTTRRCW